MSDAVHEHPKSRTWLKAKHFIHLKSQSRAQSDHQYSIHSVPDCIFESKTSKLSDGSDDSFSTKAFVHGLDANCYSTNWNIWALPSFSFSLPSKPASHEPGM